MYKERKILIIGAGVAGRELLKELKKNLKLYKVIGFIDDDEKKLGKKIGQFEVLGTTVNLAKIIKAKKINEVLIAVPSAEGSSIKRIIEICSKQRVTFKIIPRVLEIILGNVKLPHLREVELEDLLGRQIVRSDQDKYLYYFKNKKILVTGAAGSIGSELCRQLIQFNLKRLIAFDIWENGLFELDSQLASDRNIFIPVVGSIQDKKKLENVFLKYSPDIIFHAAAYKHVPLMQENPDEAVKNNVFGTLNLAMTAAESETEKFINISTDKAADPSSVMGATKLLAERIVASLNNKHTKFGSVRFGNVLGSQGSVIPTFKKQIAMGGPVTVTHPEMTRYFMTIPEAVQLVLEASLLVEGSETFVLDMGQPIKIDEMARLLIRLSGFDPDKEIKIVYTGIRPGEKLSEVLYTSFEILGKTQNEKIYALKQKKNFENLKNIIRELEKLTYSKNKADLIHFLRKIAPNLQD